jgi:FMN phosphatase YigB (HAD superfamily)
MVGDCPTRDIAGSSQAGLRTIWVRRGRTWDPGTATPDATVDDVSDTVSVLRTPR